MSRLALGEQTSLIDQLDLDLLGVTHNDLINHLDHPQYLRREEILSQACAVENSVKVVQTNNAVTCDNFNDNPFTHNLQGFVIPSNPEYICSPQTVNQANAVSHINSSKYMTSLLSKNILMNGR